MIVIDNGSDVVKACDTAGTALEVPNVVGRSTRGKAAYVGRQMGALGSAAYNGLVLCRPAEQGFLCDATLQNTIWGELQSKYPLPSSDVVLTVVPLTPNALRPSYEALMMEMGNARRLRLVTPTFLVAVAHPKAVCVVVDVGYSASWVVPYIGREPEWASARRVDVGGMFLTNALKEALSYRQYNLMADTWLVNTIKHRTCYVAADFDAEVKASRDKATGVRYVLPNGNAASALGSVLPDGAAAPDDTQVLHIGHERFSIPELLFSPSDIGILQGGLAEAVAACVATFPPELHGALLDNIVLTGGCVALKGLRERLAGDLVSMCETGAVITVTTVDMRTVVARCAAMGPTAFEPFVSREQYSENRTAASANLWGNVK